MKVTLISPYENVASYGMRCLSAVLKQAGFETQMVFLPRETEGLRWEGFRYAYSRPVLDQLTALVRDSSLIGMTLMTNYFDNAVQITRYLRRSVNASIIWGGIHATVRPEECLEHADMVCVGEGEDAMLELTRRLANGYSYEGIENIWYVLDNEIVRTPLRAPALQLDRYPPPDYDLDGEFVLHHGDIRPMTPELLLYYLRYPYTSDSVPTYWTSMSRGCAYSCTYCCNSALRNLYGSRWRVRRRSVGHFVEELKQITSRFPGIRRIQIQDDMFPGSVRILQEFKDAYRQTVNRPLLVAGFVPGMIREDLVDLLIDAGMDRVRVGVQTGSTRVMKQVYRRPGNLKQAKHAFEVLHKFTDRIEPPLYDLIMDNPWETEEDQLATLRMLLEIPKPYQLQLFSLTFFPGTALYERARKEGILRDDLTEVYRKLYLTGKRSYMNGMLKLFQTQQVPRWLLLLLLRDNARRLNWPWLPYLLQRLFWTLKLLSAAWRSLLRWDWGAFERALRLRYRHPTARYDIRPGETSSPVLTHSEG